MNISNNNYKQFLSDKTSKVATLLSGFFFKNMLKLSWKNF